MITNPNYWDCKCDEDYIHPKSKKDCKICKAKSEDMPDSRQDEINRLIPNPSPPYDGMTNEQILLSKILVSLKKLTNHGLFYGNQIKLDDSLSGLKFQTEIHELIQAIQLNDKNSALSIANNLTSPPENVPAVNFIDFCKCATSEQIQSVIGFYYEEFVPEKVPEYFKNWSLKYDDSKYKNGIILTNKHSTGGWKATITINDGSEYTFGDDNNWQYLPKTFSEFISDGLRHEDFDLIFSEMGLTRLFSNKAN